MMARSASARAAREIRLAGRDARIGETDRKLGADGSDKRAAVIFVKRYLSFGLGAEPDWSAPQFVGFVFIAWQQMPMHVRFRIAQAFVVHLPWLDDGGDRFGHHAHFVGECSRDVGGHQVELGRVELREQHAVAAVELLVAEDHVAALQLRNKIAEAVRLDPIDHGADSASRFRGRHLGSAAGTSTSLMLAPLSISATVWSLYGRA